MEKGFSTSIGLVLFFLVSSSLLSLSNSEQNLVEKKGNTCNMYQGQWVYDASYPLFDSLKCSWIGKEFDCLKYGRTDRDYLKYRWQPSGCNLPRFDGRDFLTRMRGKKIMFIGDSVSGDQMQSLLCLLQAAVGGSNVTSSLNAANTSTVTFQDYGVSISHFLTHYLVDIENEKIGRVLRLSSLKDGAIWKQGDVLIFNTWLWWYRRGPKQPWDYIEYNGTVVKDIDRMVAFHQGLETWSKWVNAEVDTSKTKVFFQGISPQHYDGKSWNEPGVTNCGAETKPLNGSTFRGGDPASLKVLRTVLRSGISASKNVRLLDITTLSQLRKDGHPSKYNAYAGMDCTHWCVAGVIDTWNLLLYTELINA